MYTADMILNAENGKCLVWFGYLLSFQTLEQCIVVLLFLCLCSLPFLKRQ
uniref:Uncharacterized protein n=1 Tax=Anguilla anguilla TaxID=7936 RepID=A0A0E9XAH8_ANGAN